MTQEEKARKYEEVLEKARECIKDGTITHVTIDYINTIFPELFESEDERIRKVLVGFFKSYKEEDTIGSETFNGISTDKILAWLERQGMERKQLYVRFGDIPSNEKSKIYCGEEEIGDENGVSVYPAFELNRNIVLGLTLPITKTTLYTQQHLLEYDNRPCYLVSGDYVGKGTDGEPLIRNISIIKRLDNYRIKELEKQDEEKPYGQREECLDCQFNYAGECKGFCVMKRDEQKPKFKVGDWIVFNGLILYVKEVVNGFYRTISKNDDIPASYSWDIDNEARLWTIQDAKDGDVLTGFYGTFIFMGESDGYCGVLINNRFIRSTGNNKWTEGLHPATKEQRDLLFSKIKEAGYEYDTNKKESNKFAKFKVGDWIINNDVYGDVPVKIKEIDNYLYLCERQDGMIIELNKDAVLKEFKHWDITDAKDGDVLICPKYAGDIIPNIFIFKDVKVKDNDVFCHCSFSKTFMTECYVANADPINTDFYPATKEQRYLLFQKMKEEGYEWDWRNKELKKLTKFKIGDKIINKKGEIYEVIDTNSYWYTIKDHDNNEWYLSFDAENKYQLLNKS